MISCRHLIILALAAAVLADEQFGLQHPPQTQQTTTGFTLGKHVNANIQATKTGQASGSIYGGVGFQAGEGPSYYTPANIPAPAPPSPVNDGYAYYDASQVQQSAPTSLFSSSNVNYYATGAVILGVLLAYGVWVLLFNFGGAAKLKELGEEFESEKKDDKVATSKKSRRRRAIQKNEEAARLASIVLSAIESGECLEKSICLMGSQIAGTERGKLASTLLEKLVPQSVQGNTYFLTLRKALKGEAYCKEMRCTY